MSTPSPFLVAAAPAVITALQALQQFETDIGPNPLQWPVTVGPAKLKLLGTLGLQLPGLVTAEAGAVEGIINTTTNKWIADLQAIVAAKPA